MTLAGATLEKNTSDAIIQTNMAEYPSKTIDYLGRTVTLTWIKLDSESYLNDYSPITQAYGILFNDRGEILRV